MAVAVSGRESIDGREIRKVGVNVGRADVGFHFPFPLQNADLRHRGLSLSLSLSLSVARSPLHTRSSMLLLAHPVSCLASASRFSLHSPFSESIPLAFFSPDSFVFFPLSTRAAFSPRASLSSARCKLLRARGGREILALHPRRCFYVTPPVTQRVRASNGRRKDDWDCRERKSKIERDTRRVYVCIRWYVRVYMYIYIYMCVYTSVWRIQGRVRDGGRAGGGARLFSSEYVGQQRLG